MLLAYRNVLQENAKEDYGVSLQVWASQTAFGGKVKPPELPDILK